MPYKDPQKAKEAARKGSRRWREKHPEAARESRLRHYAKHRDKLCAGSRAWYRANKERVKRRLRRAHLLKRYGLTPEQYDALGDACAICGAKEDARKRNGRSFRLAVDHDHDTGRVRGLLCANCNCGIGYFKHDGALMQRAIEYLKRE